MANNNSVHLAPKSQAVTPANFLTIPRNCFFRCYWLTGADEVTPTVTGTVLRPDGSFQQFTKTIPTLATNSNGTFDFETPEGLLIGLLVSIVNVDSNDPTSAFMFALHTGNSSISTPIATIGALRPTALSPDGYPNSLSADNINRNSYVTVLSPADFAGNSFKGIFTDNLFRYELLYLTFFLDTDATSANRHPALYDADLISPISLYESPVTASKSKSVCASTIGYKDMDTGDHIVFAAPHCVGNSHFTPAIKIINGKAGDTITQIKVTVIATPLI